MKARYVILLAAVVIGIVGVCLMAVSDQAQAEIGKWLVYACLPACNGFPLWYGFTRPWHQSQIGRALMTKALGVMALFDLSAVAQAWSWRVPPEVALVVIGAVVAGVWYQFLVLCATPRAKRGESNR